MSRRKRAGSRHTDVYKSRPDMAGIACLPKNRLSGWRIRWVGGRTGVGRPRWEMKRDLLLGEAKRELLLTEHLRLCCSLVFVPVPRRICPRFQFGRLDFCRTTALPTGAAGLWATLQFLYTPEVLTPGRRIACSKGGRTLPTRCLAFTPLQELTEQHLAFR